MKNEILYINVGGSLKITSIYKKITGQILGLNRIGVTCTGVVLSPHVIEKSAINQSLTICPVEKPKSNFFHQLKLKRNYINALEKLTAETTANFIYLRYPFAHPKLIRLIKNSDKKFIIEFNSKTVDELLSTCKSKPFSFSISHLLGIIQDCIIPYIHEYSCKTRFMKHAHLTVGVTNELARHYQHNTHKRLSIPNGINAQIFPIRKYNPYKTDSGKCIMLILDGTSTPTPWQGLDRLIKSVLHYGLEDKIEIQLAGTLKPNLDFPFLKQLGFLEKEALTNAVNEAHIGTGNLCLFRKNLKEGSVLKNREYTSRGLPILFAMDDDDYDHTPLAKLNYKISNSMDIIDLPKVLEWLQKLYESNNNLSQDLNKLACTHFSFESKMQQLKDKL